MMNQLIIYLKKFCTSANYYVLFSALLLVTPAQSHQPEIQSTPGDTIRHSTSENEIRTVIVDNYFPYTFVNEQGEPDGLSVELIKAVAKELGMDCRIEVNTWSSSLDMLQAGEVNALSIMAYSEERDKNYDFSAPYTIAFDAYFTRKNSPKILTSMDLKEKKIIVNKKDQAHDYLKTLPFITQDHYIYESNTAEALKLLSSEKGDVAVMPKVLGLVLIKKLKIENLVLDPPIIQDYERPFSFAVKKGNFSLLKRLENGLQIIKETGEYQKIHTKWLGAYEYDEISLTEIIKKFSWFILAFILISGVLLLWTFMLRRQVALRTRHLEAEITERKQAEEALRESEEEYKSTLNNLLIGVVVHAHDTSILFSNPEATNILGLTYEQMSGKKVIDPSWNFVHENSTILKIEEYPVSKVFSTKKPLYDYVIGIIRPDKDYITWAIINAIPVFSDENELDKIIVNFIDITALKQSEEKLARLNVDLKAKNEELEQVVYVASHDLRSPLVNIEGYSRELEYSIKSLRNTLSGKSLDNVLDELTPILDEDIPEALRFIRTSTKKMDMLLGGLLRLSRSGRAALKIESVDMNQILSNVVASTEFQIKENGVEVIVDDLPPCQGDAIQMGQVFSNLLDNALKCLDSNRPGMVRISGEVVDGQSVYCVEDNGIGIDVNHIDKIFEIFHQLDPAQNKGEGLGLTIVKRILTRLKGSIRVESTIGLGSCFYVSMPKENV